MATLVTISADFRMSTSASASVGTAGETILPFQLLYLKAADGKLWLASNASAAEATLVGIAATGASADDFITYVPASTGAFIESASALWAKGTSIYVADTAGSMFLSSDIGAGDYITCVGLAVSTTKLQIVNAQTGVAV